MEPIDTEARYRVYSNPSLRKVLSQPALTSILSGVGITNPTANVAVTQESAPDTVESETVEDAAARREARRKRRIMFMQPGFSFISQSSLNTNTLTGS